MILLIFQLNLELKFILSYLNDLKRGLDHLLGHKSIGRSYGVLKEKKKSIKLIMKFEPG
jgi:hypothetical protein